MGALESESRSAREGAQAAHSQVAAASSSALQQQAELQALRQQMKGAEASSKAQAAKLKEEQARVAAAEQQVNGFGGISQESASAGRGVISCAHCGQPCLPPGHQAAVYNKTQCLPGHHWQHAAPAQLSVGDGNASLSDPKRALRMSICAANDWLPV